MIDSIRRGQIYMTNFGEGVGSEQTGLRPALILQNNMGNQNSPTIIVAPITSKTQRKAMVPTHFYIGKETGLDVPSLILLEQIRTISKERLCCLVGELSSRDLKRITYPLALSLGLIQEKNENLVLTLCKKCASDYRQAHYKLLPRKHQSTKETCMCCNYRMGYDYEIIGWK